MRISDILRGKGNAVATVRPDATVGQLLGILAELNIGAVVVSADETTIAGIVSERDVVRRLHERGGEVLEAAVSEIMTARVHTCGPDDEVEDLRKVMTAHRIRHVPVVTEGSLVGLVSIGDVVKSAIDELETEREHLVGYLHGS